MIQVHILVRYDPIFVLSIIPSKHGISLPCIFGLIIYICFVLYRIISMETG